MKVYFVGFGPGSKEFLTLKAYKILKGADIIIYPGSLIDEKNLEEFEGEKINSYGKTLEELVNLMEKAVKEGKIVARVVSGDPSIFSAVWEQARELKKRGIDYEIIPGVSSVFASAAAIGIELTSPSIEGLAILRPAGKTLKKDHLEEIARFPITLVILLGAEKIEEIASRVAKVRGLDEPCAVVYKASLEDQKVIVSDLGRIAEETKGIKKMATIIIGKVVKGYEERSKLYESGNTLLREG